MTRRDSRLLAVLVAAPAALFLGPLFLGRVHYMGDVMRSFQPWLTFAAQEIQAGRLPLWNPYAACGEPFLANPQTMIFFPLAQLFWLFPFADGWRLFLLLAQALLTVALYLLYRRSGRGGAAFGALAVAWGGFTLVHWEFPGALATMPFAAFFLLFAARGDRRPLPFATALLFLAGYTQFSYYAVLIGGAFALALALRRKDAGLLVGMGVAVVLGWALASPQLLATWEAVRHSVRAGFGAADARTNLLAPFALIKFLVPDIYDKAVSPYAGMVFDAGLGPVKWSWLSTFYVGAAAPTLALGGALAARREKGARAWAIAALAGLAAALGVEPFFSLLRRGVPGMRYMTHFSNAMLITLIAGGALAARGLRPSGRPGARRAAFAALAAGALAAAFLAFLPPARAWTMERLLGLASLTAAQDQWVAKAALAALLSCAAVAAVLALPRGRTAALLLFTLFDLWRFGHDLQPTVPDGFFQEPVPLAQRLQGRDDRFSIDPLLVRDDARPLDGATPEAGYQSLRQTLFMNLQVPFRIHQTWGYEVFPGRAFTQARRTIPLEKPFSPVMDFLGARDVLAIRALPPPAAIRARRPNALLYENPGALPRVTWVPNARVLADGEERLRFMAGAWDPRREVVLEEGTPPPGTTAPGTMRWNDGRPGRLDAAGRSEGGWLVWSQNFYPGWEAWVNGEKVPLRRANHAFQAVALPSGEWRAVLLYRPRLIFGGIAAAAALMTAFAAAGLMSLKKL